MSKFKPGDKVRRKDGGTWSGELSIVTVREVQDDYQVYAKETGTWVGESYLELVQKAPTPRKHAELIKQWADDDSLVVQYKTRRAADWRTIHKPCWSPEYEHRFKPKKSPQEIEKEAIVAEMEKLQKRLDNLEVK